MNFLGLMLFIEWGDLIWILIDLRLEKKTVKTNVWHIRLMQNGLKNKFYLRFF